MTEQERTLLFYLADALRSHLQRSPTGPRVSEQIGTFMERADMSRPLRVSNGARMAHREETLAVTFSRKLTFAEERFLIQVLERAAACMPKQPEPLLRAVQ